MSGKEIICACSKSQDLVTDLEGNRITGLPARSCQLFGSLAVCGGSFTHAAKINLNQSVFRQVNVSATPGKEECQRGSETHPPCRLGNRGVTQ